MIFFFFTWYNGQKEYLYEMVSKDLFGLFIFFVN